MALLKSQPYQTKQGVGWLARMLCTSAYPNRSMIEHLKLEWTYKDHRVQLTLVLTLKSCVQKHVRWLVGFAGPRNGVITEMFTWLPLAALSKVCPAEKSTHILSPSPAPSWPAPRRSHRSPHQPQSLPRLLSSSRLWNVGCFYLRFGE